MLRGLRGQPLCWVDPSGPRPWPGLAAFPHLLTHSALPACTAHTPLCFTLMCNDTDASCEPKRRCAVCGASVSRSCWYADVCRTLGSLGGGHIAPVLQVPQLLTPRLVNARTSARERGDRGADGVCSALTAILFCVNQRCNEIKDQ